MLIGYITFSLPLQQLGLIYVIQIILLIYWFWVGFKFSDKVYNPLIAIISGNIFGIISLGTYYWQYEILTDQNMVLAVASHLFTISLAMLSAKIALFFGFSLNTVTMRVIGTLIMIIIFMIGYMFGKRRSKG